MSQNNLPKNSFFLNPNGFSHRSPFTEPAPAVTPFEKESTSACVRNKVVIGLGSEGLQDQKLSVTCKIFFSLVFINKIGWFVVLPNMKNW